jgi:amidohydrolase
MQPDLYTQLTSLIAQQRPELCAWRHDFHHHPEVRYEEIWTSRRVAELLGAMGIPCQTGLAETGVVGLITGTAPDGPTPRCVALRADMDALPITERTKLDYASTRPGCMHACGPGGHMTILLGAAAALQRLRHTFRGTVKLIFQPAEEGGQGAQRLCQAGVLQDPPVDVIYGLHGWPMLEAGKIGPYPGALLAGLDVLDIEITGRGGHAAMPHLCQDVVVTASALVQALQTVVARRLDPLQPAVLSLGMLQAGTTFNVLPERAQLSGTIRYFSETVRAQLTAHIQQIAQGIALAYDCRIAVNFSGYTPPTVNTPVATARVAQVAEQLLGPARLATVAPAMWGEDFAFYLQKVPGSFFVLGLRPVGAQEYPALHDERFDFNDDALLPGALLLAGLALDGLLNPTPIQETRHD